MTEPLSKPSETTSRKLERQTHFVAGLLLATSLLLGTFVVPGWYALAALPTLGMFLDAATGFCPMTAILRAMPWNK